MLEEIEISNDQKRKRILTNIIKMLTERNLLAKDKLETNIDLTLAKFQEDTIVVPYGSGADDSVAVKLMFQNITSIAKSTELTNFLDTYAKKKKLIVVSDINPKVERQLEAKSNTEVFLEKQLLINLIDHICVPPHILLKKDEEKDVLATYNVSKKDLPFIRKADPVSKYYNAQSGQIFRIIRPSETSGKVNTYRVVV